jgi:hypothetical protein
MNYVVITVLSLNYCFLLNAAESTQILYACNIIFNTNTMHTSEIAFIQKPPTCFGPSSGNRQGANTNDKKLKDDTLIERTGPIQDIK